MPRSCNRLRLDYFKYHTHGVKVPKIPSDTVLPGIMDLPQLELREKKIFNDLTENFLLFSLDELDTEEEISDGLFSIEQIGKDFRHIHVEIQDQLKDDDAHAQRYPAYDDTLKRIRSFQKIARSKLKELKLSERGMKLTSDAEKLESEKLRLQNEKHAREQEVRDSILVDESLIRDKVIIEIEDFTGDSISSIEKFCSRLEHLLDEYFSLISRAKIAFGNDFDTQQKPRFDATVSEIRAQIKAGKVRMLKLSKDAQDQLVEDQLDRETRAAASERNEQRLIASALSEEIVLRCDGLTEKCNYFSLQDFDDFKILECSKELVGIDTECREILTKFTRFSQVSSHCDPNMVSHTRDVKEQALKCRNTYAMTLHDLMMERDITEEKLKKSLATPIDLEKFTGFNSKMDIYTFRSEFERLIQPGRQKIYWLDILRRNYLSGAALTLVEQVTSIDEAWKKLLTSFGDVRLLLQNKLASLDNITILEGLSDVKLVQTLTKLTNIMIDLSNLAVQHNLLYRRRSRENSCDRWPF